MLCRRAVAFVPRRPARAAIARIDSLASAGEDCATNHGKIGDGNTFDTNDYVADSVIDREGRRCAAGNRAEAALGARRAGVRGPSGRHRTARGILDEERQQMRKTMCRDRVCKVEMIWVGTVGLKKENRNK